MMQRAQHTCRWGLVLAVLLTIAAPGAARGDGGKGATELEESLPLFTHWRSYGLADGLPSRKITSVLVDGEDVWAGTDRGLARLRNGSWQVFSTGDGLCYPVISSLALSEETGDLWVGTLAGLSRFSAGRFDSFNQLDSGLINDVVYAVEVIGGDVWVATAAGLSVYKPRSGGWELFDHENTVMHEPWCYGLCTAPGRVYVAVWGGGVVEHDLLKRTWKAYRDPDHEMEIDLFRDDGLVHDVTSSVDHEGGVLWVGTYFGLSRHDGTSWRSFLEHDSGLPSNFINVVRAHGRWVWIGTDDGLAAFDGSRWLVYRRGEKGKEGGVAISGGQGGERSLSTKGELAHNYVLWVAPAEDRVWVATAAGLSLGTRHPTEEAGRRPGPSPGASPPGE
ncbi:MAG: regulator [Planctomycetota bacterium]